MGVWTVKVPSWKVIGALSLLVFSRGKVPVFSSSGADMAIASAAVNSADVLILRVSALCFVNSSRAVRMGSSVSPGSWE
jgi:hypothetical protein